MFNTQIKQHEDYKLTNNCRTAVNITVINKRENKLQ